MAPVDWNDVTVLAPELDRIDDAAQDLILDVANTQFEISLFGGEDSAKLKLVRCLFAAHFATELGGGATAGPIVSEALVGAASFTYAGARNATGESQYQGTPYGRRLLALLQMSAARVPIALGRRGRR